MRTYAAVCIMMLAAAPAVAAPAKITLYLDGARVEREAAAVKGEVEVPLPPGMAAGSLRVKPLQGAAIAGVEIESVPPDLKAEKEIARLTERRESLTDRLKALDVKEEIFRAAAKSQSGKAPRATKTNREPLESVRKGTEFALSQLEDVYRARRKTERELKAVEARLASLGGGGGAGGRVARVRLAGKAGRVAVSYLQPALKWTPSYDFRLAAGGEVEIVLSALLPALDKGAAVAVVPSLMFDAGSETPIPLPPGGAAQVALFRFPLEEEKYSPSPVSSLSFSFINRSARRLPAGESACYRQGEFIGKARFEGCLPGESKHLDFGKVAAPAQ